jgi:hypothetical protein
MPLSRVSDNERTGQRDRGAMQVTAGPVL